MNIIKTRLHCPYCGKSFEFELEEHTHEDDLLEECPMCGNSIEIRLVVDEGGKISNAEVHQLNGDADE